MTVLASGADVNCAGVYFVHDFVVAYGSSVNGVCWYLKFVGDGTLLVPVPGVLFELAKVTPFSAVDTAVPQVSAVLRPKIQMCGCLSPVLSWLFALETDKLFLPPIVSSDECHVV